MRLAAKFHTMELKYGSMVFLLYLFLSLLNVPRGGGEVANSEVYEIDYRGPETHTSVIPPPVHYRHWPLVHRESATASHKLNGRKNGENVKKVRG